MNILFEDNHLLVVEKPINMPSQEDRSRDMDVLRTLKHYLKEKYNKPGNVYLGLVHRLDRPVGGVMVLAKTSKAASRLSNAIRERTFQKEYAAVVHGCPQPLQGTLIHYLQKDAKHNQVRCSSAPLPGAKQAVLDYKVAKTSSKLSLLHIILHTGRPHQIRAQLSYIGCPLYGDQKYGADVNRPGQQIALWSTYIGFTHPTTKEPLHFYSTPANTYPWSIWTTKTEA